MFHGPHPFFFIRYFYTRIGVDSRLVGYSREKPHNPFSQGLCPKDRERAAEEHLLDNLFLHQRIDVARRQETPQHIPVCCACGQEMVYDKGLARGGKFRCANPNCEGD